MEVTRERLYQNVARDLLKAIQAGDYPPGSRLPGERELAERLNVSRVTIREAEIALEAQGFISIRNGSGAYVLRHAPPSRHDDLPAVSAFELTTARMVIESEAAALAAVNLSDEELAELQSLVQGMAAAEDGSGKAEELDRRFHLTIAHATGNPAIEHLIGQLWRMRGEIAQVRDVYASVCNRNAEARTQEHLAIFEALQQRNSAAARAAMREHFHRLFDTMLAAREDAAIAEIKRSLGEDRQRFLQTSSI